MHLADLSSALILGVAGAAAAAALAANGGRGSPELDLISQFAPIFVGAGLLALVAAIWVQRWAQSPLLVLGFLSLVGGAWLMAPEFLRDRGPVAPANAAGQIKIIQFNALQTNENIGAVADWLAAEKPDIVTIQEARHDLRDVLKTRTGWHVAGAAGSLMIFSRAPRIRMDRPALGPESRLHWVNATYPSASGPYEVVTVHLGWPLGPGQRHQWTGLAALLRHWPTGRMILTGDFNATPWSYAMRAGEAAVPLFRRDRAIPTFPAPRKTDEPVRAPFAILPIDHVYAGPGWATVKVARGPNLGSDHYPLIVTLAPVMAP
jgi:endonuclease/exonuclease/phosphatase (EEP) superfamily protein YafD